MGGLLLALWVSASPPCPPLAGVELPGRLEAVVSEGCSAWLLTTRSLARVGPSGAVERTASGVFAGKSLSLDAARDRLYVVTAMLRDDSVEAIIEARRASTLEVQKSWGTGGTVRFKVPRKAMKPHASTGGDVAVQVRADGSLAVVTRADSVEGKQSLVSAWSVSPAGVASAPTALGEIDGPMVGGRLVFALAPDGRGFVATCHAKGDKGLLQLFGLTREGRLDPSFGDGGRAVDPNISSPVAAHAVPSGWMLTGGHASSYRVVVTRYLENGRIDASYGALGRQVLVPAPGAIEHPRAMAALSDGGVLVAGVRFWKKEGRMRPTLIPLSADGALGEVSELELVDAPQVDPVGIFVGSGLRPRLAGFSSTSPLDKNAKAFWRELGGAAPGSEPPAPATPEPPAAPQTIYRWVDGDGVEGFATSLGEVPEKYRSQAKPFTP